MDKEELRADKAVKVTRKELNTLIAELFEFTDTFSEQEQEISKKRKTPENTNTSIDNNIMVRWLFDFYNLLQNIILFNCEMFRIVLQQISYLLTRNLNFSMQ